MGIFSSSKPDKVSKASKPERPSKPASLGGTTTSSTSASSQSASPQSQAVIRPVFLLVWPNALFKVHWAVFIPDASDPTCKRGKYYHVEGSLKDGFRFEIVRGWDISKSRRRPHSPIEIGAIPAELVVDIATNDKLVKEAVPRDRIDAFFASVQPPSQSLNSVSTSESAAGGGRKTELSDCQWWVTKCVRALVERGMLFPARKGPNKGRDPREILAQAPRH